MTTKTTKLSALDELLGVIADDDPAAALAVNENPDELEPHYQPPDMKTPVYFCASCPERAKANEAAEAEGTDTTAEQAAEALGL